MLYNEKIKEYNNPLISIIIPSFNKKKDIMKSIRAIQNQSFRNIEIIIIDDCSKDNSDNIYENLLKNDPRIRLFFHLKNMGIWRTRIDVILYPRGKYILHFKPGDLSENNYVLEDAFNIKEKYSLDTVKMFFRLYYDYNLTHVKFPPINYELNYTQIYNRNNMHEDSKIFGGYYGVILNQIVLNEIYVKGLYLLSDEILNVYKNLWEERWWKRLIKEKTNNALTIKRFCYLYYKGFANEHLFFAKTEIEKDRLIHEFIYFLYFDMHFLPKKHDKQFIVDKINKLYENNERISIKNFRSKFYIIKDLINRLINDEYVADRNKILLGKILEFIKINKRKYENKY